MLRVCIVCLLLVVSIQLLAQRQVNKEFSGRVKLVPNNACLDAPMEDHLKICTILFYDANSGELVTKTATDEDGFFTYAVYTCRNCIAVVDFVDTYYDNLHFERKAFLMKDEYLDTHFEIELMRRCPK